MKLNSSFLVGLAAGALVSGIAVWLVTSSAGSENNNKHKKVSHRVNHHKPSKDILDNDITQNKLVKDQSKKNNIEKVPLEITTVDDSITIDTVLIDSSDLSVMEKDTSAINFMVRKDVLMRTLTFKFANQMDTTTLIDSLKESLDIVEKIEHETYFVELWESPLGFSGYKTSGNRIMVFGLDSVATFDLKMADGYKVLKANKTRYKIMNETEFRPLSKLTGK